MLLLNFCLKIRVRPYLILYLYINTNYTSTSTSTSTSASTATVTATSDKISGETLGHSSDPEGIHQGLRDLLMQSFHLLISLPLHRHSAPPPQHYTSSSSRQLFGTTTTRVYGVERAENLSESSNESPRASTITKGCRDRAPENGYLLVAADD